MKKGFSTIMSAQFFSSLADNALLVAAIELLNSSKAPTWHVAALPSMFALFLYARRRRREEPVITAMKAALGANADASEPVDLRHAAQLVIEIAYADAGLAPNERARVEHDLRERWGLAPRAVQPPSAGPVGEEEGRLGKLGQRLSGEVERERRLELIEQMWQSLFSDRTIDAAQEAWLLARSGELLGLAPEDASRIRSRPTPNA